MTHASESSAGRARRPLLMPALAWLPALVLAPLVAAQLVFFAVRAWHMLAYPFPLDYGEGPLLAQAEALRAGTPIWALYGDPGAPPYAVVNYPPVYLLATLALSILTGASPAGLLLAGRLVSLLATIGCVAALWVLSAEPRTKNQEPRTKNREPRTENQEPSTKDMISVRGAKRPVLGSRLSVLLTVLAFLGIPIVREWAAVMRVDMLGVCLGLWGLVLARRAWAGGGRLGWPALLLALSLFVKPSLLAAPTAALLWLLLRDWRAALRLGVLLGVIGGAGLALLHLASGGWFLTHVVAANSNPIDRALGASFWEGQLDILRPLFAAGALGGGLALVAARRGRPARLLPVFYALFGAAVALGVGKVGAYLNYFLELYAGLVWLAAAATEPRTKDQEPATSASRSAAADTSSAAIAQSTQGRLSALTRAGTLLLPLLVGTALLRYVPLWSETYLKPYGLIEGQSPPRVVFGGYGVWQDLRREAAVLGALGRVNASLADEVRAAGAPIFTDLPGIAAQAGQLARHQAFEHRQLLDAGLWDQRPLLRDMAGGRVPLVALDYLGNWLTPEMIALITHRYAQDGSRGPYDLYRPVAPGPLAALALEAGGGLRVAGVRLAPPGGAAYSGGELLVVTTEWQRTAAGLCETGGCEVVLRLTGADSAVEAESARPLLYGALPPADWAGATVQHMQAIALPVALPPGEYGLTVALRAGDDELAPPQALARVALGELSGRVLGDMGYFVPAPLLDAWARDGGYDGPGDPITPAVPFEGFTAQCFRMACYRLAGGAVERVPLEELLALGRVAGEAPPESPGDAFMRLPGGVPYRWP